MWSVYSSKRGARPHRRSTDGSDGSKKGRRFSCEKGHKNEKEATQDLHSMVAAATLTGGASTRAPDEGGEEGKGGGVGEQAVCPTD